MRQTLVVYLLDVRMEQLALRARKAWGTDASYVFLEAVTRELAYLPPETALVPHILTRKEIRRAVAAITRPVYPRMAVLAMEELSPDVNIQPIARIAAQD